MKTLKGTVLALLLMLGNTLYAKCFEYDETGGKVTALDKMFLHGTWKYKLYNEDGDIGASVLNGYMIFEKGLHVSRKYDAIHSIERMVESPSFDKTKDNDHAYSKGGAHWGIHIPAESDAGSILRYLSNHKLRLARESVIGDDITFGDMDLCKFDYRGSTLYYFSLRMASLNNDQLYSKALFKKISDEPIPGYASDLKGVTRLNLNLLRVVD